MRVSEVPWGGEHGHGPNDGVTCGVVHNTYGFYRGGDVSTVSANGSAHFVVGREEGEWVQLADTDSVTWNCGNSNANHHSVAIEFSGTSEPDNALTDWQCRAGGHIVKEVSAHHGIELKYDIGDDGPNDTPPWSGWYAHRAILPDSGSQHGDYLTLEEWACLTTGADDMTKDEMKALLDEYVGPWMKQQTALVNQHIDAAVDQKVGVWFHESEARIIAALKKP